MAYASQIPFLAISSVSGLRSAQTVVQMGDDSHDVFTVNLIVSAAKIAVKASFERETMSRRFGVAGLHA